MKTISKLLSATLLVSFFSLTSTMAQTAKKDTTAQKPKSSIPTDVNAVLTNSCARCHGENGRARPALDLAKWEEYTAEMKAKKAQEAMRTIDNGSMPPKGYLSANPSAALNKDQITLLRNWSESLTLPKKK
jgi:cytochrome c5